MDSESIVDDGHGILTHFTGAYRMKNSGAQLARGLAHGRLGFDVGTGFKFFGVKWG